MRRESTEKKGKEKGKASSGNYKLRVPLLTQAEVMESQNHRITE